MAIFTGKVTSVKESDTLDSNNFCDHHIQIADMDTGVERVYFAHTNSGLARVGDIMTIEVDRGNKPYFWYNQTTGWTVQAGKDGGGILEALLGLIFMGCAFGFLPLVVGILLLILDFTGAMPDPDNVGLILFGIGIFPVILFFAALKKGNTHSDKVKDKRVANAKQVGQASYAEAIETSKQRRRDAIAAL